MIALAIAMWRAPRARVESGGHIEPAATDEMRRGRRVGFAIALATVLLVGLLAASIVTDRALATLPLENAVNVSITAHQWWWDIRYDDPEPSQAFSTANELYVPVGRPVIATLTADDVIHSFWVPSLHGKKDLIPGRTATIRFRADAPGHYRGACAEFCGWQHAHMYFEVVAVPPAEYDAWVEAQRKPAAEPTDETAKRGRDLFLSGSCMMCHAIQGTSASAHRAPDLTHVAARSRLAAGAIDNTPGELAAWILDPQKIKPGVNMPANPIEPQDLQALVAYLETLK
jgi:cytochrome c oxidase subunit 2